MGSRQVTVVKDPEVDDFGFSLSDGFLEKGVYVNMIRADGPAERAGLRPFDRILQVRPRLRLPAGSRSAGPGLRPMTVSLQAGVGQDARLTGLFALHLLR